MIEVGYVTKIRTLEVFMQGAILGFFVIPAIIALFALAGVIFYGIGYFFIFVLPSWFLKKKRLP